MDPVEPELPAGPVARLRGLLGGSLVRNSLLMMGSTALNLGLGFLFVLIAARVYSISDVGLGSAIVAAMALCSAVGSIGVGSSLVQELPRRASGLAWRRTLLAGLAVAAILSLVAAMIAAALLPVASDKLAAVRDTPLHAVAFVVGAVILATADMLDRAFIGERRTHFMLGRNVANALLKIALLAPFLRVGGEWGVPAAWVLATVLSFPVAIHYLRRLGRGFGFVARGVAREAYGLRHALTGNHAVSLGNIAPQFVLPLLVTAIVSDYANGIFTATWRIGSGFMVISVAVAQTLLAEVSHEPTRLRATVRRATVVIGALLVPAVLFFAITGEFILGLLKPEYTAGYPLLLVLLVAAFPDAVTNVAVVVFRHERRYPFAACVTLGMATTSLVVAALLLPHLGIVAVGWAWLIAQSLGCVLVAWDVRRRRLAARPRRRPAEPHRAEI